MNADDIIRLELGWRVLAAFAAENNADTFQARQTVAVRARHAGQAVR